MTHARVRLRTWITGEAASGAILLAAAMVALVWANSPWREGYAELVALQVGPSALHLDLSLGAWAADGLLAVFFFVVGVELKHEFRAGSLSNPREAAVPMLAALGGMAVPAVFYVLVASVMGEPAALAGWAIPTATDIAFALAVLAVFGRGLPLALRTFLLTLAVVDDLLAIVVIAVFYTDTVRLAPLAAVVASLIVFRLLVTSRFARVWFLIPVALVAWWFMHESGVHATVAGVLLGFCVPATAVHGEPVPRTVAYEHRVRPISAGIALPMFAFFSAGVTVVGTDVGDILSSPIVIGIVVGLVAGKVIGVLGVAALITRFTRFRLPQGIGVRDLVGVGLLTGIGFTVALLVAELSFPGGADLAGAKVAILLASLIAAVLAAISLRWDARRAREPDMNRDGVADDIDAFIGSDEAGGRS
ncbi:Na+/H+ antiporter NhaA [Occultella glacieicola]|uniref:Na(+)/H(+) antiporter NhaA n=2 Tax=Occultella glacieicola TaxID=2518684 RepID=A0ABY2E4E5_9MICO|nr:Na+/H+ antiporter NhaA [Occultella glacieicola]